MPIDKTSGRYEVSDSGRVFSLWDRKPKLRPVPLEISQHKCKHGYMHVCMRVASGGRAKRFGVHQLVCEAFHGPKPSPLHQVGHIDGDRTNNNQSNLKWVTIKENCDDRARHGNTVWGERATRGKLKAYQVQSIRQSSFSLSRLASIYGVSKVTIFNIRTGRTWKRLCALSLP